MDKIAQIRRLAQKAWVYHERARFQMGTIGRTNADGTVTVNAARQDFVYITLDTGTLTEAHNGGSGAVQTRAGLPVRVREEYGRLVVDGVNTSGLLDGDTNAGAYVYSVNNVAPDSHGNVTLDTDDVSEGSTNKYTTATSVGAAINAASTDDTIDDTDTFGYTTGSTLKKTAWSVIKSTLKTYFDTLYDKTATIIAALSGKTTPLDADGFVISDSAASGAPKLVTGTNLKAYMKTYWDTIYAPIAKGVTNGDSHDHNGGDGAQIPTGGIVDAAVTLAKMANIATDSLIGRDTAGSGDPENITLNATLSMDGSGHLQRAALTGDVSASAGSNATTIGNNKVLTAMIADAQVTLAKMADLAQSTIIGRAAGAGTGVPTALSVAQVVAIINSTLDHGGLAGLGDDDHSQYHNDSRGDARYVQYTTASSVTTLSNLGGGSATIIDVTPGSSITTSQTWTIDIKCASSGNRVGGLVDIWLYGLASGTGSASIRLLYKATIAWYRNTAGATASLVVNEAVNDIIGITFTGPTAIADGFRFTVAPSAGTLDRVGYNIVGTGTGINIAANTVA